MRINNYVKDTLVTANDKWIGSDFNNFSQTKNFTPITIADFYNSNQVLNSPYLSFTYKTYPGGIIEEDGIISFYDNNADIVPFSSITQFLVSAKSANANTIADYLDFINGGKITLSRGTDVNSFGFFKITNVVPYDENTNFFLLTVEYITGHGDLLKDKSYMMTLLFDKYSYNQTLQDVTTNGNTTTNDIILNSISGEYGDYTVINTLKDLGLFPVFSSILGEDYSSYYAGYGFGSSSSLGTLSKAIDAYESSFYVQSLDTSNSNYTGSIGLEGTDANGSPFLSLTNKTRNIGKLKVTNIVNAITLQFPNKIPGDYTIATIDDIISPEGFVPYIGATSDVDLGNVNIIGQYLNFYTGFNYENFFTIDNSSGKGVYIFPDKISLSTNGLGINGIIKSDLLTTIDKTYQLPNNSGTLALTSDVPTITGHALTKVNDTNVTLTLGGIPSTSLLQDVSLTLGWTGTLADSRIASASSWNAKQNAITTGTTSQYLRGDLSLATFPTNISSFTNDSGYLVSSALTPYLTSALAASTYEPKIVAGTTSQYWRGDKTWQAFPTIPTVGTWGALNYPTWSSGTPFVKMTAAGTFALDTNTYLTGITSGQVTTALGYTPVTNARTLTINGTSYDLTADRSWTISTFTSPLTTKGDIYVRSTVDTRLPVGTDGQYLISDSTQSTGLKWQTLSLSGYVPYSSYGTNNVSANNFFDGFTSVVASGTLITLTVNSTPSYLVTGSGGQVIKLPDATTLPNGAVYDFNNNQSSGAISVNNNSNTLVKSIPSGGYLVLTLIDNSTAAGSWDAHFQAPSNVSWSTNTFDYAGSITSATWNGVSIADNRIASATTWNAKEDSSNKVTTFTGNETSTTKFPVVKAILDYFTAANIKTILGITTLSGSNTGDQDLSGKLTKSGDTITGDFGNTSTGYFRLPNGTTAQRPGTPLNGMHRYNTDTLRDEFYANGSWQNHVRLTGDTFTGAISATNLSGTNTGNETSSTIATALGYTPASQDGTILYHSLVWFTPTGTVSSSGTTVTSIGTQFTSAMVGAKLTISGESRIITAFTSNTQVTVASAYSQNYSGVAAGSWGVYSRSIVIGTDGLYSFYTNLGITNLNMVTNQSIAITGGNAGVVGDNFGFFNNETVFASTYNFKWSSTTAKYGTKDLGLARNSAGLLEITDGTIASGGGGLLVNRRDLLVRNVLASQNFQTQPSPTAISVTSTLTIANLLTNIINVTSAVVVTLTLPTGTLTDAGVLAGALPINTGFDWTIINTGSSFGVITLAAGTGHTIVGSATIALGASATFRTVKTATNTFITYTIA